MAPGGDGEQRDVGADRGDDYRHQQESEARVRGQRLGGTRLVLDPDDSDGADGAQLCSLEHACVVRLDMAERDVILDPEHVRCLLDTAGVTNAGGLVDLDAIRAHVAVLLVVVVAGA